MTALESSSRHWNWCIKWWKRWNKNALESIEKVQQEKRFLKKRKIKTDYNLGNLVVIKRMQYGAGMTLRPTFYGLAWCPQTAPKLKKMREYLGNYQR